MPGEAATVDYAGEGLLDGVDDGDGQARREALVDYLLADGAALEEIKQAQRDGRLALLPVERFLRRECEFSLREASEQTGVTLEVAQRNLASLRLPIVDADQKAFSQVEVDGFGSARDSLAAGLSHEAVWDIASVFGQTFTQLADGIVEVLLRELGQQSRDPDELALRLVAAAEMLMPAAVPALISTHRMHLRSRVAREVITQADTGERSLPGAREVVVAFADLEGFTPLSERAPLDVVSGVATRFADVATNAIRAPVTLVKMVGDAAMLVAPEPDPLVEALFTLSREAEREELPPVHAGMASGQAISRLGDWYGRPVNLASRVTAHARAGTLLATAEVRDLSARADWERAGVKRLKGFDSPTDLYRLQTAAG